MPSHDTGPPEVEPLTDDDRRSIRERLELLLEELRAQLELLKAPAAPGSPEPSIGRPSGAEAARLQVTSASRRRVELELRQVGTALRRMQGKSYGECVLCGGAIGRHRLLAQPATPYCRHCEEDNVQR